MGEEDYDEQYPDDMELAIAGATEKYKSYLIDCLIELTQMSERVMSNMIHGTSEWEIMDAYIARLIHLLIHLYPLVDSGGSKTDDLKKEFDSFKSWIYQPTLPIENREEGDRLPELMFLIRRAYDRFNLTSLR
jgi:hypothetical protein